MEIAVIGENEDGSVSRLGGVTPEYERGVAVARQQMEAAGLQTEVDPVHNLVGTLPGSDPNAKAILIGSHLDTVTCGGKFDGVLGVSGGIEVANRLKEEGRRLRHPLQVWGFNLEEASLVGGTFGSRSVVGFVDMTAPSFEDRLAHYGWTTRTIQDCRRDLSRWACYLEYHIEQGDKLDNEKIDIGVVNGIVSVIRYDVTAKGMSNHAGTTMMANRKDALVGMSKLIVKSAELAREIDDTLVFTVGKQSVQPGQENVIPCQVDATFEMRHMDKAKTDELFHRIQECAAEIPDCEFSFVNTTAKYSTPCDPKLIQLIDRVCEEAGVSHTIMPSGAGHDANAIAHEGVPIGMIFVPSAGGKSHCGDEWTDPRLCDLGADILYRCVLALDEELD